MKSVYESEFRMDVDVGDLALVLKAGPPSKDVDINLPYYWRPLVHHNRQDGFDKLLSTSYHLTVDREGMSFRTKIAQ